MFLPCFSLLLFLTFAHCHVECNGKLDECEAQEKRYLIYGVNFGEGFNLRRDVYLRIANVVRQLREKGKS